MPSSPADIITLAYTPNGVFNTYNEHSRQIGRYRIFEAVVPYARDLFST